MTHKSIELPEEIYNKLLSLRRKDENLVDTISRLIKKPKDKYKLEDFDGVFEEDSEEWEKIEKILYRSRLKNKNNRSIDFDRNLH